MKRICMESALGDIRTLPELKDVSEFILYSPVSAPGEEHDDMEQTPIREIAKFGWHPEALMNGVNYLADKFAAGKAKCCHVYKEEECTEDAQKKIVNIVYIAPEKVDPQKPYIMLVSGGAYMAVASAGESYPIATHLVEAGYPVFVLTYRVGEIGIMPKPMEDMAGALRVVRDHAEEFGVDPENYVVCGCSAGANLVCTWSLPSVGYGAWDMPKPKAVFAVYTVVDLIDEGQRKDSFFLKIMLGENYTEEDVQKYDVLSQVNEDYPPCYIVCGKDDETVPCYNSERLKARLDELGTPAVLNEVEHGPHGFGDGSGTDAEGWPEEAVAFLESL
ncbi:MAG: alpha/beta hydrolase [Clostridiales bacterium]|nr:alpha/beta hydrolase [Clostridiales bacterium]